MKQYVNLGHLGWILKNVARDSSLHLNEHGDFKNLMSGKDHARVCQEANSWRNRFFQALRNHHIYQVKVSVSKGIYFTDQLSFFLFFAMHSEDSLKMAREMICSLPSSVLVYRWVQHFNTFINSSSEVYSDFAVAAMVGDGRITANKQNYGNIAQIHVIDLVFKKLAPFMRQIITFTGASPPDALADGFRTHIMHWTQSTLYHEQIESIQSKYRGKSWPSINKWVCDIRTVVQQVELLNMEEFIKKYVMPLSNHDQDQPSLYERNNACDDGNIADLEHRQNLFNTSSDSSTHSGVENNQNKKSNGTIILTSSSPDKSIEKICLPFPKPEEGFDGKMVLKTTLQSLSVAMINHLGFDIHQQGEAQTMDDFYDQYFEASTTIDVGIQNGIVGLTESVLQLFDDLVEIEEGKRHLTEMEEILTHWLSSMIGKKAMSKDELNEIVSILGNDCNSLVLALSNGYKLKDLQCYVRGDMKSERRATSRGSKGKSAKNNFSDVMKQKDCNGTKHALRKRGRKRPFEKKQNKVRYV